MKTILVVLVVAAAVEQCCDSKHDGYVLASENAKICLAKGGIPITTPEIDAGGHTFQILTQCAFPCDQRLTVEK